VRTSKPRQIRFNQAILTAQVEPAIRRDDPAAESRFKGGQQAHRVHIAAVIVRTKVLGLDNLCDRVDIAAERPSLDGSRGKKKLFPWVGFTGLSTVL